MLARFEPFCLALLVAASLAYHAATLSGQSLFVDEVSEMLHARGTLAEAAFRADSMPPTFTLLVRGWVATLGEGTGVRWLSVACSLLTIPLVWLLGRRLGSACGADSAMTGLLAAAVFAALPLQLYYAQLIRGYALMTLAAALATLAFVRAAEGSSPRRWWWFATAGVLGVWCHYYFVVLLIVLLAGLIARRGWKIGRGPVLAAGLIVIGGLPLLPFLREDFGYQRDLREARPLTPAAAAYTGLAFFSGYSLGPSKSELHEIGGREAARRAAPWGAALAVAATPLLVLGGGCLRRGRWLVPVALLAFGPILVVGLLGRATGITYNPRFVAWCVVPLAIWLGVGIAEGLTGKRSRCLATTGCLTLLAGVCGAAVVQRHALDRYRFEDLTAAAVWLADHADPDEPVFVMADYFGFQLTYHANLAGMATPPVVELPRRGGQGLVVEDETLVREGMATLAEAAGGGAFWLVESRAFHTDPGGLLRDAIRGTAELEEAASFAGVKVYRGTLSGRALAPGDPPNGSTRVVITGG